MGSEPGTAAVAAASAAIKWLSKDGFGALGRLLVGSRLGAQPDVDPKMMRMHAGKASNHSHARSMAVRAASRPVTACLVLCEAPLLRCAAVRPAVWAVGSPLCQLALELLFSAMGCRGARAAGFGIGT